MLPTMPLISDLSVLPEETLKAAHQAQKAGRRYSSRIRVEAPA